MKNSASKPSLISSIAKKIALAALVFQGSCNLQAPDQSNPKNQIANDTIKEARSDLKNEIFFDNCDEQEWFDSTFTVLASNIPDDSIHHAQVVFCKEWHTTIGRISKERRLFDNIFNEDNSEGIIRIEGMYHNQCLEKGTLYYDMLNSMNNSRISITGWENYEIKERSDEFSSETFIYADEFTIRKHTSDINNPKNSELLLELFNRFQYQFNEAVLTQRDNSLKKIIRGDIENIKQKYVYVMGVNHLSLEEIKSTISVIPSLPYVVVSLNDKLTEKLEDPLVTDKITKIELFEDTYQDMLKNSKDWYKLQYISVHHILNLEAEINEEINENQSSDQEKKKDLLNLKNKVASLKKNLLPEMLEFNLIQIEYGPPSIENLYRLVSAYQISKLIPIPPTERFQKAERKLAKIKKKKMEILDLQLKSILEKMNSFLPYEFNFFSLYENEIFEAQLVVERMRIIDPSTYEGNISKLNNILKMKGADELIVE